MGHSNNKAGQSADDLGTKATRARIIINDHKQTPLTIHNKEKVWITRATHLKTGVETNQLTVTSTLEMNTMTEQTWVITKAL
jgi:hypothetical protein